MFKRTSRGGALKSGLGEINWKRENSIYQLDDVNKPPEMLEWPRIKQPNKALKLAGNIYLHKEYIPTKGIYTYTCTWIFWSLTFSYSSSLSGLYGAANTVKKEIKTWVFRFHFD